MSDTNISEQMRSVLSRCDNNETVSLAEINATPEIQDANKRLHDTKTLLAQEILSDTGIFFDPNNPEESREIDTMKLSTAFFNIDLASSLSMLWEMKSARLDDDGTVCYDGDVEKNRRLDIVIGLPASGKSSAVVDIISHIHKARIVDNDEAKKTLTKFFDNGFGADLVHAESQMISEYQLEHCLRKGENIVIPKVGGSIDSIQRIINRAALCGYEDINVHYVELPRNKAMGRMLRRLVEQNRYLSPELIQKYDNDKDGNKISKTFDILKQRSEVKGYAKWNNDVEHGKRPVLVEHKGISDIETIRAGFSDDGQREDRRENGEISIAAPGAVHAPSGGIRENRSEDLQRSSNGGQRSVKTESIKQSSVLSKLEAFKQKVAPPKASENNQSLNIDNDIS